MGFFAVSWEVGQAAGPPPGLEGSLDGWTRALEQPGLVIWTAGPRRPPVRVIARGAGVVIGDLFSSSGPGALRFQALIDREDPDPLGLAQALSTRFWGRYVAILRPDPARPAAIFRDPSGAVEALSWSFGPYGVIASSLPEELLAAAPPDLTIDWACVGDWLAAPGAMAGRSALAGVDALGPGVLRSPGQRDRQVWAPADWIGRRPARQDDARCLEETVERAVTALAGGRTGLLVEVSGGLDSSIVAAILAKAHDAPVVQWLNYRATSGEGDERAFAGLLASSLGITLTEAQKPPFALSAEQLAAVSHGPRPGLNGMDSERDRDIAGRAQAAGADTIVTGQGGDMVFFQTPTPLVAVDHLRAAGLRGLLDPALVDTARWLRRSVWKVARLGLADRFGARLTAPVTHGPDFVVASPDAPPPRHPWLEGLDDAPPAKRLQVVSLIEKQTHYGQNLRSAVADVIHPLMAQPILELCLSIPAPTLVAGGRDRALARRAFADRLPAEIAQRRTKGSLGGYYARMAAASLGFLRPFLLEGRLVQQGLVLADRLDPLLSEEQLTLRGDYPSILFAAVIEAWVRGWEANARRLSGV
jgi:asparagine synthase (glutamine-hydrolysing)